jgi:hypothetical protein
MPYHTSYLLLAAFLLSVSSAMAQQSAVARSAGLEAIASAGTLASGSDELAARALYVKLRPGFDKGDAPAVVRRIGIDAGLEIRSTSSLAYSTIPLAPALQGRIESMSPARRAAVERAEEDLGRIVEVFYDSEIHPLAAARMMQQLPEVEYAEPIYLPHTLAPAFIPNDPRIPQQPHLEQIKAFDAWDIWKGDSMMVIGIVDVGVDQDHEDLAWNIAPNPGESGVDANGQRREANGKDDDANGVIDDYRAANLTASLDGTAPGNTKNPQHGTAVASFAAATTNNAIGIAGSGYLCRFFPVKSAKLGSGTIAEGYNGILYCARRGIQVINCSWGGGTYSQAQQDIINTVVSAYDVAIVAAGGNNVIYDGRYPAGYRGVLGVAAVDQQNSLATTWGEQIGVSSPVGLGAVDNNLYDFAPIATSFASPIVAGVVALVRSRYPELSAAQALAHVRLTADTVESANPAEKFRLAGYGRLNALRAVSEDPFSHPALVIDSIWLTDESGDARNGFLVGERGIIRFRVKNILGDAASTTIGAVTYRDDSTAVTIDDGRVSIPALAGGASVIPSEGIPFTVRGSLADRLKIRFLFGAAGGYDDYQYDRILLYRPYITVTTPKITVSLTDRAQIGYSDYPTQSIGDGFQYEGKPLLYEGGFILATDSVHLISNVRSEPYDVQQMDFTPVETPTAANNLTTTVSDQAAPAERRIGIEMKTRMVTREGIDGAVGFEVTVKNTTSTPIDSLHLAMFQDFDLSPRDQIAYVETPTAPVEYYGKITGSMGLGLACGVAEPLFPHTHSANGLVPIFTAITNNADPINIFNGFSNSEKWMSVGNGVFKRTTGQGDVSMVIGTRFDNLLAGEERSVLFVIGVGPDMTANVEQMNAFATPPAGVSETKSISMLLGQPRPNPAGEWTSIVVTNPGSAASLRIYDTYGRMISDQSGRLGIIGEPTLVWLDTRTLPAGMYHIRLAGDGVQASRSLVIVR